MDDLTVFLKARLDEDEAAARAATPGPWVTVARTFNDEGVITDASYPPGSGFVISVPVMSDDESRTWADQEHVARHDPARVLREVAAKRAILAAYLNEHENGFAGSGYCEGLEEAVKIMAAIWSDHEDYREAWRL